LDAAARLELSKPANQASIVSPNSPTPERELLHDLNYPQLHTTHIHLIHRRLDRAVITMADSNPIGIANVSFRYNMMMYSHINPLTMTIHSFPTNGMRYMCSLSTPSGLFKLTSVQPQDCRQAWCRLYYYGMHTCSPISIGRVMILIHLFTIGSWRVWPRKDDIHQHSILHNHQELCRPQTPSSKASRQDCRD